MALQVLRARERDLEMELRLTMICVDERLANTEYTSTGRLQMN